MELLKTEVLKPVDNQSNIATQLRYVGIRDHLTESANMVRAYMLEGLWCNHKKHIYDNDLIAGSLRGMFADQPILEDYELLRGTRIVANYDCRSFGTCYDHFSPNYERFLTDGVDGTLKRIEESKSNHANEPDRIDFLNCCEHTMHSFSRMALQYADAAEKKFGDCDMARNCRHIAHKKPETFAQALQLVWLAHVANWYSGHYANALGRLDQYLLPYYHDISKEEATELLASTLIKIGEHRTMLGGEDVVNIAVGGMNQNGSDDTNELSFMIVEGVKRCMIPGPNLSARIHSGTSEAFLDTCLQCIGTGLGYPALMNDEINIVALKRQGYKEDDCYNYTMVGCIENFMTGKQPPWTDGRFNNAKCLEFALNNGRCLLTGNRMGPDTGNDFMSIEDVMNAYRTQVEYAAEEYYSVQNNNIGRVNPHRFAAPFCSILCDDCIGRGLDINNGGTIYASAHGVGLCGVANVADSMCAIEQEVFVNKTTTFAELQKALQADFVGYEELQKRLLAYPKYGNNSPLVDKYAVWFLDVAYDAFNKYFTYDGGRYYIAMATNVANIGAGEECGATPDGRNSRKPLNDAASPMHGMDKEGPVAVVQSISQPDYTKIACGSVINQKFSPAMLNKKENRQKVQTLIRTYFKKGGQEMQINSVSRDLLKDAIAHPENYADLVVRVSGFSAYFTTLDPRVQLDILERTEHDQ